MNRLKCREIHEKTWCPEFFRDAVTEFLSTMWKLGVYRQAMDKMVAVIRATHKKLVVDLCSGAGDYIPILRKQLAEELPDLPLKIYKTDLYPNKKFFDTGDEAVEYWQEPLAADEAFEKFDAVYCMFSALHHFDEADLEKMFRKAAQEKKIFMFFDISQRRWLTDIIPNIFLPGVMWIATLFVRKFTWKHLLFIYLLPIVPLITMIDGTISRMKAYKLDELKNILSKLCREFPDYRFELCHQCLMGGLQKVTCVAGGCPEIVENESEKNNKK